MARRHRLLATTGVWFLAVGPSVPVSAQDAPPRDRTVASAAPSAVVSGRVATAAGQPLQRVRVTFSGGGPDPTIVFTNAAGVFEATALPAGSYSITATRAGYLTVRYGQRRPREIGRTLLVRDREVIEHVDIVMPRGAVLAGRVVDELGEVCPGARVEAVGLRYIRGRRVPVQAGLATTNDLGEYRITGLEPGAYYIRASSTEMWADDDNKKGTHAYALTYFPGALDPEQAQTLTVATGQQLENLDVSLLPGRAVRVSGVLQSAAGEPLAQRAVSIDRILRTIGGALLAAGPGGTTRTDESGAFEIADLAPGEYNLYSRDNASDIVSMPLMLTDADVQGIVLTARRGVTLRGAIVSDEGTDPAFSPGRVRVRAIPTDSAFVLPLWGGASPQTVAGDWSFRVVNLEGGHLFRLEGLPDPWMVKAVRFNGRDITDTSLDIPKGGPDLSGLEMVVTRKSAQLSGDVVDERGQALPDSSVLVFGADRRLWGVGTRFVRLARPDRAGHFTVGGLPAGSYLAIAKDYIADGEWENPEFLETVMREASKIELSEASRETVTLKVKPEEPR